MPTAEIDPMLTKADLAEVCRVSERTVETWRATGSGPRAVRVGKHLRWRISDVREWLDSRVEE